MFWSCLVYFVHSGSLKVAKERDLERCPLTKCGPTNAADSCDKRVHSVTSEHFFFSLSLSFFFFFPPLCSIGTSEQRGSMRPEDLARFEEKSTSVA